MRHFRLFDTDRRNVRSVVVVGRPPQIALAWGWLGTWRRHDAVAFSMLVRIQAQMAARIGCVPTLPPAPMPGPMPSPPPQSTTSHGSRRTRWIWAVGSAAMVSVAVVLGLMLYGLRAYANADHLGVLDDPVVVTAADKACAVLQAEVKAGTVPKGASAPVVAGSIRAQDAGIERLIAAMRLLGTARLEGDHPANLWLADWETLARIRESYTDTLGAGDKPRFALPTVDGIPISQRMSEAVECPVVLALTAVP